MPADETSYRAQVLLSIQRALIGSITPQIRFISVEWSLFRIHLHVYIDGDITSDGWFEDFDTEVMTQVMADFPTPDGTDPQCTFAVHRVDPPMKPHFEGDLVYGRREASPDHAVSDSQ